VMLGHNHVDSLVALADLPICTSDHRVVVVCNNTVEPGFALLTAFGLQVPRRWQSRGDQKRHDHEERKAEGDSKWSGKVPQYTAKGLA